MQILRHFPHTVHNAYKPQYDRIVWRNNKDEFEQWKLGNTGYPMVDVGMRQLNETGQMTIVFEWLWPAFSANIF